MPREGERHVVKLILIPQYGPSMSAQHQNEKTAELDGELLARMILSAEEPNISADMTAQFVAARLGVPIADADRFKSLYTVTEIMGLRNLGLQYVEYVITDHQGHTLQKKQVHSDAYKTARRLGARDVSRERPN